MIPFLPLLSIALVNHRTPLKASPANSPLNVQLGHLPGFTALDNPGGRYRAYAVDQSGLTVTQTVAANDALQAAIPYPAIDAYNAALAGDANEAALAYTGLGLTYDTLASYSEAAASYEEAIAQAPGEPALYTLLSFAYREAGESSYAIQALQSGVDRLPENTGLRTQLASLLMFQDAGAAVRVQREVVDRFPEVTAYRVKLGTALAMGGDEAAADRQFERAISQNPLSPKLRAAVALANQIAGRDMEAFSHYERALELEPDNPHYHLSVGNAYAGLSTEESGDEEYFEDAEEHLRRAGELAPRPGRTDVRAIAWSSLGYLYVQWGRTDQAVEAYERALEADPQLSEAQQKWKGCAVSRRAGGSLLDVS